MSSFVKMVTISHCCLLKQQKYIKNININQHKAIKMGRKIYLFLFQGRLHIIDQDAVPMLSRLFLFLSSFLFFLSISISHAFSVISIPLFFFIFCQDIFPQLSLVFSQKAFSSKQVSNIRLRMLELRNLYRSVLPKQLGVIACFCHYDKTQTKSKSGKESVYLT